MEKSGSYNERKLKEPLGIRNWRNFAMDIEQRMEHFKVQLWTIALWNDVIWSFHLGDP